MKPGAKVIRVSKLLLCQMLLRQPGTESDAPADARVVNVYERPEVYGAFFVVVESNEWDTPELGTPPEWDPAFKPGAYPMTEAQQKALVAFMKGGISVNALRSAFGLPEHDE